MEKKNSTESAAAESPRKTQRRPRGTGSKTEDGGDDLEPAGSSTRTDVVLSENGADNGCDADVICEDVTVAIAGKKTALRGKVWRSRNGDYIRYRCIDDGAEYRPGGNLLIHIMRCFEVRQMIA